MEFPVIRGVSYALIHSTGLLLNQGTTQRIEYKNDPQKKYYHSLTKQLRNYEQAIAYPPNQVYIGNLVPDNLKQIIRPWHENVLKDAKKEGKYGAIFAEDELFGLMKIADSFNLVVLEENFQKTIHDKMLANDQITTFSNFETLNSGAAGMGEIKDLIDKNGAEPLAHGVKLVGCVKKAHQFDHSLSSIAMLENLVSKASAAYTLKLLFRNLNIMPEEVDYIIECSEEAVGDMNQRGGGNIAKAIGEMCGCVNATGSDTRSFCSAPVHAIIQAAGLVQSGIFKNVIVIGGGSTAKLGMNSREHLKKEIPILEDMLGTFAVCISDNDGINPIIRTDSIGKLNIGSGSSPQATMNAIVLSPLEKLGLKIADVDRFAAEMQNPELTEPAGAGNIPLSNYKMIAALGVQKGEFEKADLMKHVDRFGMEGFAPTQGHIPSGIPFLGHCRDMLLEGSINRGMIIGKGSLFLGRLTNLFDGVSFIVEMNRDFEQKFTGEEEIRKVFANLLRDCANALKE